MIPGRYLVRLTEQLRAENDPSPDRMLAMHAAIAGEYGLSVERSYVRAMNGFSVALTREQLLQVRHDSRVHSIEPERVHQTAMSSPNRALELDGSTGVWADLGGQGRAGSGIVIGVLDSGIAPEHPSFHGSALTHSPGAEPYRDGDEIVFTRANGREFRGKCESGEQFSGDDCSTTLIGARYFLDGVDEGALLDASEGEYRSPRDGTGHGSHTAAIATGRPTEARVGYAKQDIVGVAPDARLAVYKVCWSGRDRDGAIGHRCPTSAILAGIESAIEDGVDVLNYSIESSSVRENQVSLIDEAFLNATAAGISVTAAAGNNGSTRDALNNAAPWVTTVAATTTDTDEATVRFSDSQAMAGSSISVDPTKKLRGTLLLGAYAGSRNGSMTCSPGSLEPSLASGKIVLCDRGDVTPLPQMATEVARVGGVGLVAVNVDTRPTEVGAFDVPTVNLSTRFRTTMKQILAEREHTVVVEHGNTTSSTTGGSGAIRRDSSRGPHSGVFADILKPDVSAPGSSIASATSNAQADDPTFTVLSGTSMAAPHVAGLAALIRSRAPSLTPAMVASAISTTARSVADDDGATPESPLAQGSGSVDARAAVNPGLVLDAEASEWRAFIDSVHTPPGAGEEADGDEDARSRGGFAEQLNLPSVVARDIVGDRSLSRTFTALEAGEYRFTSTPPPGFELEVTPARASLDEGETVTVELTLNRTDAPFGVDAFGELRFEGLPGRSGRLPVIAHAAAVSSPARVSTPHDSAITEIPIQSSASEEIEVATSEVATMRPLQTSADDDRIPTVTGGPGAVIERPISVPRGVLAGRIAVVDPPDGVVTRVHVTRVNDLAEPVERWWADTDGVIDLETPAAGTYIVRVEIVSGNGAVHVEHGWAKETRSEQALTLDPGRQPVVTTTGGPNRVQLRWVGSQPAHRVFAAVRFGDDGPITVVDRAPRAE